MKRSMFFLRMAISMSSGIFGESSLLPEATLPLSEGAGELSLSSFWLSGVTYPCSAKRASMLPGEEVSDFGVPIISSSRLAAAITTSVKSDRALRLLPSSEGNSPGSSD